MPNPNDPNDPYQFVNPLPDLPEVPDVAGALASQGGTVEEQGTVPMETGGDLQAPAPAQPLATGQEVDAATALQPEIQDEVVSTGDAFAAGLQTESLFVAPAIYAAQNWLRPQATDIGDNVTDNANFNPFNYAPSDLMAEHYETFAEATSQSEVENVVRNIRDEQNARGVAGTNMATLMVASMSDPTILIPGVAAAKVIRAGGSVSRVAAMTAGVASATVAMQEAGLHALQHTRTPLESLYAVGGAAVLGGLLGAGAGKLAKAPLTNRASARVHQRIFDDGEMNAANDELNTTVGRDEAGVVNDSAGASRVRNRAQRIADEEFDSTLQPLAERGDYDSLSRTERKNLEDLGINEKLYRALAEQVSKHGWVNRARWDDVDVGAAFDAVKSSFNHRVMQEFYGNAQTNLAFNSASKWFSFMDPVGRGMNHESSLMRQLTGDLAEVSTIRGAEERGISTGQSVEATIRGFMQDYASVVAHMEEIFAKLQGSQSAGSAGAPIKNLVGDVKATLSGDTGRIQRAEFQDLVGKAMRRGDSAEGLTISRNGEEIELPKVVADAVEESAALARKRVFDPMAQRLVELGALSSADATKTAESYFTRVWDVDRLLSEEGKGAFSKVAKDYMDGELAAAKERAELFKDADNQIKDAIKGLRREIETEGGAAAGVARKAAFTAAKDALMEAIDAEIAKITRFTPEEEAARIRFAEQNAYYQTLRKELDEMLSPSKDLDAASKALDEQTTKLHDAEQKLTELENELSALEDSVEGLGAGASYGKQLRDAERASKRADDDIVKQHNKLVKEEQKARKAINQAERDLARQQAAVDKIDADAEEAINAAVAKAQAKADKALAEAQEAVDELRDNSRPTSVKKRNAALKKAERDVKEAGDKAREDAQAKIDTKRNAAQGKLETAQRRRDDTLATFESRSEALEEQLDDAVATAERREQALAEERASGNAEVEAEWKLLSKQVEAQNDVLEATTQRYNAARNGLTAVAAEDEAMQAMLGTDKLMKSLDEIADQTAEDVVKLLDDPDIDITDLVKSVYEAGVKRTGDDVGDVVAGGIERVFDIARRNAREASAKASEATEGSLLKRQQMIDDAEITGDFEDVDALLRGELIREASRKAGYEGSRAANRAFREVTRAKQEQLKGKLKEQAELRSQNRQDNYLRELEETGEWENFKQQYADHKYDRIVGTSLGRPAQSMLEDGTTTAQVFRSNRVKGFVPKEIKMRWNIDDSKVEDLLVNNASDVMESFTRSTGGYAALRQHPFFESLVELDNITDDVMKELAAPIVEDIRRIGAAKGWDGRKIANAENDAVRDIKAMTERLLGTYGMTDSGGVLSRGATAARVMKRFNYITLLGGMVVSAVPDVARPVMVAGLMPALKTLTQFWTPAGKMARRELRRSGTIAEILMNSRTKAIALDGADRAPRTGKIDRATGAMADTFGIVTFMSQWNQVLKEWAGLATADALARNVDALSKGKATKQQRAELAHMGIDADTPHFKQIVDGLQQYGEDYDGLFMVDLNRWLNDADPRMVEAGRTVRNSMTKMIDKTIVTPGMELPNASQTPYMGLLFQFKSFVLASFHRTLLYGLQKNDLNTYLGTTLMVALGGVVSMTKNAIRNGGEVEEHPPEYWLMEGIDRSGALSIFGDFLNLADRIGLGPRTALGLKQSSKRNSDLASILLGPTASRVNDLGYIMASLGSGDMDQSAWRKLSTFIPYNNLVPVTPLKESALQQIDK